jgi:hypothetical protein
MKTALGLMLVAMVVLLMFSEPRNKKTALQGGLFAGTTWGKRAKCL